MLLDPPSFDHVAPHIQPFLAIEGRGRVGACWEYIWVKTPATKEAFKALQDCVEANDSEKPDGLVITGDPDTGKSYLLGHFAGLHKPHDDRSLEFSEHPAICILAPSNPDFPAILERLLEELGHGGIYNQSSNMMERYTKRMLTRSSVKVIIIDELFDIDTNARMQPRVLEFLGSLKNFINTTKRPIVASGVPELADLLLNDPQIATRFETKVRLRPMTLREFLPVLLAYERQLPLRNPSHFKENEEIVTHLWLNTAGYIGRLSRLLKRACRLAIDTKQEQITLSILEQVQANNIRHAA